MKTAVATIAVLALTVIQIGCDTNTGVITDTNPPTVSLEVLDPIIATCQDLRFTVTGADNIFLKTVGWTVTGVVTKDTLIQFTSATLLYSRQFTITEELAPGAILIVAEATDDSGNEAIPDSTFVHVVTN